MFVFSSNRQKFPLNFRDSIQIPTFNIYHQEVSQIFLLCRFSPNFWWGNLKFQSPSALVRDDSWWEGGTWKKIHWSQMNSLRQQLTHFWCFNHVIKHSDTVLKPKYCQNWCKTVVMFFKFLETNLMGEGDKLWSKKGTCIRWGDWSFFFFFCQMGPSWEPL